MLPEFMEQEDKQALFKRCYNRCQQTFREVYVALVGVVAAKTPHFERLGMTSKSGARGD
jgi:hypothetical protein